MNENLRGEEALSTRGLNRRTAIKTGIGVAGAAVLWTEPTIKGLARRPAYAQACSTAMTTPVTFTIEVENNSDIGAISVSPTSFCGVDIEVCQDKAGNRPGLILSTSGDPSPVANAVKCGDDASSIQGPFSFVGSETGDVSTGGSASISISEFNRSNHRALFVNPATATYTVSLLVQYTP